ncbi:MAG TPA: hypothetical protein VFK18_01955 [Luteimonas sp.]|nr:hypothetical protein [Luteimonas sp.]
MSDFDTAAAEMDAALFDVFGEDATISRADGVPAPVRVVLTRGVERSGDYGQVVGRVTVVDLRNSEWVARPGDVLQLASGARTVASIESDDGSVNRVVLHG